MPDIPQEAVSLAGDAIAARYPGLGAETGRSIARLGVLPEQPDTAAAEAWLLKVRREFYREAS